MVCKIKTNWCFVFKLPFLKKFGYLQSNDSSQGEHESDTLYTQESIQEAIKEMQRFADLPQSGELDAATLAVR